MNWDIVGVGPGDEVITTSISFPAAANDSAGDGGMMSIGNGAWAAAGKNC